RARLEAQLDVEIAPPVRAREDRRPWFSPAAWWRVIADGRTWAQLGYLALWIPLASVRLAVLLSLGWGAALVANTVAPGLETPTGIALAVLAGVLGVLVVALATQALALLQLRLARALLGRSRAQEAAAEARAAA